MGSLQEELIEKLGAQRPQESRKRAFNKDGRQATPAGAKGKTASSRPLTGTLSLKKGASSNGARAIKSAAPTPALRNGGLPRPAPPTRAGLDRHNTATGIVGKESISSPQSRPIEQAKLPHASVRESQPAALQADFGGVRQPALAREREYRPPAAWVHKGYLLQDAEAGAQGRVLRVRLGIDFGTAYTKVAVRLADKVFFVTWEGVCDSPNPYLLPGELSRDAIDALWLGRAPGAIHVASDLKLPFIKATVSADTPRLLALSYLAWVMRYARAWLYEHLGTLVRGRRLAWEVNVGCPTNSWMSSQINPVYRSIGKLAWKLSQSVNGITSSEAAATLAGGDVPDESIGEIGLDGFYLVPEFVAQVAGYANSSQRRDGLHLLVDVGAGTLDIACFELWKAPVTELDSFPIRASLVEPLGTHFLVQNRLTAIGAEAYEWDDQAVVLGTDGFSDLLKIPKEHCAVADRRFMDEVSKAIRRVVASTRAQDTKEYGYARAPEWKSGIPVFLTGGGSRSDAYRSGLSDAFRKLNLRMLVTPLRPPMGIEAASREVDECFHRLSVAYGLTQDAESIGKIFRPKPPAASSFSSSQQLDRDELYAK